MRKMSPEQTAESSGSSNVKNEEEDITQQILQRIYKFKDNKISHDIHDYFPILIVGFVSIASLLLTYQINATSGYFGSGLRVPSHNVGIFVAKLTSYRSFLMMLGFAFSYLVDYIFTLISIKEAEHYLGPKIISLFFFYLLLASRGCLLFSTFLTNNLSYRVYILLSIEAIPAGAFQMSLILLVPQFIFVTFLSIHLLAFIFFLSQFVFDLFLSHKPLVMIRIQFFMSVFLTIIGFGLWAFYLFYYHHKETKSYKEELYKQNDNIEKINSIYQELKEVSKKADTIIKNLNEKLEENDFDSIESVIYELNSVINLIINLSKNFVNLLNEILKILNELKNKVVKLYEKNKSYKDEDKDKKTFITQKNKDYDYKFNVKVSELNKLFTHSDNKSDSSNLIAGLPNLISTIDGIFKKLSHYIDSEINKELYEQIKSSISKYNKLFDDLSKIFFSFEKNAKNPVSLSHKESELKIVEIEINKNIQDLMKIPKETMKNLEEEIKNNQSDLEKLTTLDREIMKILFEKHDHIIFCYVMIALACFFRDFLYPSIIPHALLIEYEAQIILLLGIILQLLFCFPIFILDELLHIFTLLIEKYFIYFWTLAGPPFIVLIFTFLAIHTKIRFFHVITESTGRVLTLSLFLIPFNTLMESVSYACISHYVFYHLGFSDQNFLFLLFHQVLEMFCTYFFSKLSAGYNHARVRLGHCLPTYTTNYEMTFWQELWSMIKWTIQYTFKDILFFFSTNIRQYL